MRTIYQCEICDSTYPTEAEANACETQETLKFDGVQVGDIVTARSGFGWYSGDVRWVINPDVHLHRNLSHGNCFLPCCTFSFYYVVTAIDRLERSPHRVCYHLVTGAMLPESGYHYDFASRHYHNYARKLENPPDFVVKDSKQYIGTITRVG